MPKKYSINVEDDKIVSVEVNGVQYKDPADIPDPEDQAKIMLLMDSSMDTDIELPQTQPFALPKIIFPLFLGITILLLAIFAISTFSTLRALSREQSAAGQVVDMIVRKDESGTSLSYPVVEYTLPDETRQTIELGGSWPPANAKGQPLTLRYDPDQPLNARPDSFSGMLGMWILPMIMGILSIAFVGATFFVRWILKPSPAEAALEEQ
jgi:hypothetical protein